MMRRIDKTKNKTGCRPFSKTLSTAQGETPACRQPAFHCNKEACKKKRTTNVILIFYLVPETGLFHDPGYSHEGLNQRPRPPASASWLFYFLRLGKRACHAPKTKSPASTSLKRGLCAPHWRIIEPIQRRITVAL